MTEIDNVVEEFLVEEEFLSEELSKFYTTKDTNEFCCIKNVDGDDFLSTLKSKNIQIHLLPKNNYIQIAQGYAVNKIILHNVPDSVYTFTINGDNVATFNKITKFPKLNDYVLNIKQISFRNESFDDHIDLTKIHNVRIEYQTNIFNDDDVIHYSLYGYKYNIVDKTFKKQNTKYKYFINTKTFWLDLSTKYLTFLAERIDKTKSGNIYFYLAGIMVNNICIKGENCEIKNCEIKNCESVRINFNKVHNYPIKPLSFQEKYLTEKINSETLDMSRISHVQVASSNVILYSVEASYFQTYNMKYMNPIFYDPIS